MSGLTFKFDVFDSNMIDSSAIPLEPDMRTPFINAGVVVEVKVKLPLVEILVTFLPFTTLVSVQFLSKCPCVWKTPVFCLKLGEVLSFKTSEASTNLSAIKVKSPASENPLVNAFIL